MRIQARAHRRAVHGVAGLLASATLGHVLGELFRNSRRAGATRIDISSVYTRFRVTDDGCGMDDLDILLHLGASGWCGAAADEEPEGIGFFTVASMCAPDRPVLLASRLRAEGNAAERHAALYPETFRGNAPARVSLDHLDHKDWLNGSGTAVEMSLEEPPKDWWLTQMTRYCPLPVRINKREVDRVEYTAEQAPDRILKWRNSTVAVHAAGRFDEQDGACLDGRVYRLPTVSTKEDPVIRIDVDPGDGLRPKSPIAEVLALGEPLDDLKRFLSSETGARVL